MISKLLIRGAAILVFGILLYVFIAGSEVSQGPSVNAPLALVLGQKDFTSNNPGTRRDQMNWPVNVATDGQHLLVADTDNNRIPHHKG